MPIADDEFQVTDAGRTEVRIVDFGELPILQRIPYLARAAVSGAETLLVGGGPVRRGSGTAWCDAA